MMTRTIFSIILAALITLATASQQLPQFNSNEFEGWTYNNPNVELTATNIGSGKVTLYVNQEGLVLTLTSPKFSCQGMDSITATVLWYTKGSSDPDFVLSRAALTMALDDESGNPLDSITVQPTETGRNHTLELSLPVPMGANNVRLRFAAWEADVVSSGAIKRAVITAVAATPHEGPIPGDTDGNGTVNISDAIALINHILNGESSGLDLTAADMDGNGTVNISDAIALINIILNGE